MTTMITSVLVGDESLLVTCGDTLRERGHTIRAVVSRDTTVTNWARENGVAVFATGADMAANLGAGAVDWLFSIANLKVLADDVLGVARDGAVNFHDGPLPRYAGLNTPVWALLAGEKSHAVTWHLITPGIDEGDILVQEQVEIDPSETAYSLNAKCYGAGADSFGNVLDQIETGVLKRRPQDLAQRTYFGRYDRPEAGGMIDPTQAGAKIMRLVRALDFGAYWNPLCVAKIDLGNGHIAAVGNAATATASYTGAPGTVLERGSDSIVIATGSHAVRLGGLRTLDGFEVPLPEKGTVLPALDVERQAYFAETVASMAPSDARARRAFKEYMAAHLDLVTASRGEADWRALPMAGTVTPETLATAVLAFAHISCESDGKDIALALGGDRALCMDWLPIGTKSNVIADIAQDMREVLAERKKLGPVARDIVLRIPDLAPLDTPDIGVSFQNTPLDGTAICLSQTDDALTLFYDAARLSAAAADIVADRITAILKALDNAATIADLPRMSDRERSLMVRDWNATGRDYEPVTMHGAFAAQVARTPDAIALIHEDQKFTYADLLQNAEAMAARLQDAGVKRGDRVGLHLHRGPDMVASAMGILMAGAAYVPMDPDYPADRIAHYQNDSGASVVLSQTDLADQLPEGQTTVIKVDEAPGDDGRLPAYADPGVGPEDLAYLIYTSGSTGTPKGVMVEHRNLANFFVGMDEKLAPDTGGVWMAVTSMAFDISVLEIFYTLARGYTVVLAGDGPRAAVSGGPIRLPGHDLNFNLYYWGNDGGIGRDKYSLLLDGARFADEHGFNAVWTPERHFHAFGGPYPNPSVTGAAVAAVTRNLSVRAGSCVAPLHHTARIAEEWSVIDNLTNGRAGLALASGWQPDDFVLRPENTPPDNKPAMYQAIEDLRKLWRGQPVAFPTKDGGTFDVLTQPRPVSPEIPIWVTTAGNPDTWREAGEIGAHVLTHLLGQTIDEVEEKIAIYHDALRDAGHDPDDFQVTVMLHTFLADDRETARAAAREPMKDYLRSAAGLIKQYAWAFPAFKKPKGVNDPVDVDLRDLDNDTLEAILDFAFERYFEDAGMFGTVDDGVKRAEQLRRIGVTEVACLIDYGIDHDTVMEGLKPLAEVLARTKVPVSLDPKDFSIAAQIVRHGVTHLQCTPSMARILAMVDEARLALSGVKTILLGGEALPADLAADLGRAAQARILNMYGPTETTIWSTVSPVAPDDHSTGALGIGKPIANTSVYVLGEDGQPTPVGVAGELCIGGHGVTRGYWQREDLTAERFPKDPFYGETGLSPLDPEPRMYRTGDLARWRADGSLDFLGRSDFQVKIRGQRIELGEIETAMAAYPGVSQAVVKPHEDALAGYVTGTGRIDTRALRQQLAATLPEAMVPAHVLQIDTVPLTPNKKIDRKALPDPTGDAADHVEPAWGTSQSPVAKEIAAIWSRILGVGTIRAQDNFFNIGGHSLLAVQAHREIRDTLGLDKLSITDIFRFPTLAALAAHISGQATHGEDTPPPAATSGQGPAADERASTMSKRRMMRANRTRKG